MKIIFLFVLLLNIVFFFWEYRKGAPDIYLPPRYENSTASNIGGHQIVLISELPETHKLEAKADANMGNPIQEKAIESENKRPIDTLIAESKPNVMTENSIVQTPDKEILTPDNSIEPVNKIIDPNRVHAKPVSENIAPIVRLDAVDSRKKADSEQIRAKNTIVQAPDKEIFPPYASIEPTLKVTDASQILVNPVSESIAPTVGQGAVDMSKDSSLEQFKSKIQQSVQQQGVASLAGEDAVKNAEEQSTFEIPDDSKNDNLLVVACYQLQQGEYTQEMFAQSQQNEGFRFELSEREKSSITSYLVLTVHSNSPEEAESLKQKIQQQGIEELWLFDKGGFDGRISLGLYGSEAKAKLAKQAFSLQTDQPLEVVASYQTSIGNQVKVSVQDKKSLADFEQQYAMMIKQKISCVGDQL